MANVHGLCHYGDVLLLQLYWDLLLGFYSMDFIINIPVSVNLVNWRMLMTHQNNNYPNDDNYFSASSPLIDELHL